MVKWLPPLLESLKAVATAAAAAAALEAAAAAVAAAVPLPPPPAAPFPLTTTLGRVLQVATKFVLNSPLLTALVVREVSSVVREDSEEVLFRFKLGDVITATEV